MFCSFGNNYKIPFAQVRQAVFKFNVKFSLNAIKHLIGIFVRMKIQGLKTATKLELLFLLASFFKTRLFHCYFLLRCEIAFSATPESEDSLAAEN